MEAEARLVELGLTLPALPQPGGNYLPARKVGNLLYLDEGYQAARACALTQLAVIRRELGSLDLVSAIVSVNGYVNSIAGFPDSPKVINGASDLLVAVFGEEGRHVRAAIGVSGLPVNALVELQMLVAI
jgi:enamine deaminase RidA (YjgF/YER057c/UK114 family)